MEDLTLTQHLRSERECSILMNDNQELRASKWYRQVLCANSFTSLAEQSLHKAGEPTLDYPIAEGRERVKGGEAACEALDVSSVFCY